MFYRLQTAPAPIGYALGLADKIYVVVRTVAAVVLAMRHAAFALTHLFASLSGQKGSSARKAAPPKSGRSMFFRHGLGDVDRVFAFAESFDHALSDGVRGGNPHIYQNAVARAKALDRFELHRYAKLNPKLRKSMAARAGTDAFDVYEITFESPLADLLATMTADTDAERKTLEQLRTAHVLIVWPRSAPLPSCFSLSPELDESKASRGNQPVRGLNVLLPATGEQKPSERLLIAAQLLRDRGTASAIVTAPMYWHRRPAAQRQHHIVTVGDLMVQGLAISTEAATVAHAFLRATRGQPDVPVIFSGFSWGGAMTVVGALGLAHISTAHPAQIQRHDLRRVGAVPYVGCGSPGVLCEGILGGDVDWDAMEASFTNAINAGEEGQVTTQTAASAVKLYEQVASELGPRASHRAVVKEATRRTLRRLDTARVAELLAPRLRGALGALHSVVTDHDHFVPRPMGDELHRDACALVAPEAAGGLRVLEKIGGGHVVAFMTKERRVVAAISATFDHLVAQAR